MVLFIMLYKAVLSFASVDEISQCDYSSINATEQCFPKCGAVYYAVQGGSVNV